MISSVNDLPEKKRKRLENSWAEDFYRHFFSRIQEDAFAVLYVDSPSRPNVPINWLVGLETLKSGFGLGVIDVFDSQIQLEFMVFQRTTELGAAVR